MKPSEIEFITIGRILSPWGSRGQLKVDIATDFPSRFTPSSRVYINRQPATIEGVDWHKGKAVIKLDILNSGKDAEKLKGQLLEVHRSQLRSLPEGQYYHFQLIGLKVWTTGQELLGEITDILTTPNNDTYVVTGPGGETLVPAAGDIIKSIDLDKGNLIIEPIIGLLDLNKKAAN